MVKKNSNKITLRNKWISVIALFVVLFIFLLAIKPTHVIAPIQITNNSSADIANWQTYTNSELGYSFKYPSFLQITDRGALVSADYKEFVLDKDSSKYDNTPHLNLITYRKKLQMGHLG